jgi:hypothetical protein
VLCECRCNGSACSVPIVSRAIEPCFPVALHNIGEEVQIVFRCAPIDRVIETARDPAYPRLAP